MTLNHYSHIFTHQSSQSQVSQYSSVISRYSSVITAIFQYSSVTQPYFNTRQSYLNTHQSLQSQVCQYSSVITVISQYSSVMSTVTLSLHRGPAITNTPPSSPFTVYMVHHLSQRKLFTRHHKYASHFIIHMVNHLLQRKLFITDTVINFLAQQLSKHVLHRTA